jgi:hypothetical protein
MKRCRIYFTLSGKAEFSLNEAEKNTLLHLLDETIEGRGPQWIETLLLESVDWTKTDIIKVSFQEDEEEELDFDIS